MPARKVTQTREVSPPPDPSPSVKFLHRTKDVLAPIFLFIWILIGLFFLSGIFQQIRQFGVAQSLGLGKGQTPQVQEQAETNLPGIGKVNIACVQSALSQEAIQKILQDQGVQNLTDEEKAKLEPCIVEKEANPSPTPVS